MFWNRTFLTAEVNAGARMRTAQELEQDFLNDSGPLDAIRETIGECRFTGGLEDFHKPRGREEYPTGREHDLPFLRRVVAKCGPHPEGIHP